MVGWIAFAPDGKTLASSDQTQTVRLWDLATGKKRATLQLGEVVKGVQFTGDSQTLVLAGKNIKLWDVVANREVGTLGEPNRDFMHVAVAPDGHGGCGDPREVRIWTRDRGAWRESPPLKGVGYYPPVAVSLTESCWPLASTRPKSTTCQACGSKSPSWVTTGRFTPSPSPATGNTSRVAVRIERCGCGMWLRASSRLALPTPDLFTVWRLAPDASVVAAMGTDAIRVWDFAPPKSASVLRHAQSVQSVAFSPDGKMLASYGMDGTKLWDPIDGREIMTLDTAHNSWFYHDLAFSPGGRSLAASGAAEGTIDLWDVTGRHLAVLKGSAYRLAFSPSGKTLAAASDNGSAAVWDVASQQRQHTFPVSQEAASVAFSPDGKTVAAGGKFGVVKLFNARTGQELNTLQRFELAVDYVRTLAFSPDGRKLATGNRQGVVRIWDVATNRLDASLIGHTDAVGSLTLRMAGGLLRPPAMTAPSGCGTLPRVRSGSR